MTTTSITALLIAGIDWSALLTRFLEPVVYAIGLSLAGLFTVVAMYVHQKIKGTRLENLIARVDTVLGPVVTELFQTVRADYQRASADGKITPDEAKDLAMRALARGKALLGQSVLNDLARIFGDSANDWLRARIESHVVSQKNGTPVPVPAGPSTRPSAVPPVATLALLVLALLAGCPRPGPNCEQPLVARCRGGRPYTCSPTDRHWIPLQPVCAERGLVCREQVPGMSPRGALTATCLLPDTTLGVAETVDADTSDATSDAE